MAVTIPSDLELLAINALLGHVPADEFDPTDLLGDRSNWHYATHAPPIVNVCPIADPAGSQEFRMPAEVSADGLDYDCHLAIYAASATNVDVNIKEGATWGGAFTDLSFSPSTQALSSGINYVNLNGVIAAASNYLNVRLDNTTANVQLQHLLVKPRKLTTIAAAAKASGVIPYDKAHLIASPFGAAIHVEYYNRFWANHRLTVTDRRQAVFSYLQTLTGAKYRISKAGTDLQALYAMYGACGLAGRAETTVTVRCRFDDSGTASVIVGQVDGDSVVFDTKNTDATDTLTLRGELPVVYALVKPDNGTAISYLYADFAPAIGSANPLIGSIAPPPRREYPRSLDSLGLRACLDPYAITGLNFNPALAGGTYWYFGHVIPPGVYAMRHAVGRSLSNDSATTPTVAEIWNESGSTGPWDSGATAAEASEIEAPLAGAAVYPPSVESAVALGSLDETTAPSAATDRMAELTADREPQIERFRGRFFMSTTGLVERVNDIRAV